MKFKGFWTALTELSKQSWDFLKDYWLVYTIVSILTIMIGGCISFMGLALFGKLNSRKIEEENKEVEEFLK